MTSWSRPHGGIGLPTQGSWEGVCASWSWLPGTTHHLRGGRQGCRTRKSGRWNRKAAAPRANPPCGSRMWHPLPWGPASSRLRQAAQLSGLRQRTRTPSLHQTGPQSPPWLSNPFTTPPEVRDKEMKWCACKWGAARVIRTERVTWEKREVMEKTVHVKLTSWDLILDEQREVVSTRLTRWDSGWRKLTLGAARGGVDLSWSDLGREAR